MISFFKNLIYYSFVDLKSFRMWGVFLQTISNLLPDIQFFAFIRPFFLVFSGMKIKEISTCVIRKGVFVEIPRNITAGKKLQINRGSYIESHGKVIIGDDVRIAMNCKILSMSHNGKNFENDVKMTTIIKNNVNLYAGVIVLPGTVLENYVIVNSGAVIGGQTKPGGVYSGNPARLISFRKDIDNE